MENRKGFYRSEFDINANICVTSMYFSCKPAANGGVADKKQSACKAFVRKDVY